MTPTIQSELEEAQVVLQRFTNDPDNLLAIELAATAMITAIKSGKKIISCGNGGSMSDAMHFASELTGRYYRDRDPIEAIAISDPGHLTCVSNDYSYAAVFARWIMAHGKPGDLLLAISTSGLSENVFTAVRAAHFKEMKVVFLTGNQGGSIMDLLKPTDVAIVVPYFGHAARIQEVHIKVIHVLVHLIESHL